MSCAVSGRLRIKFAVYLKKQLYPTGDLSYTARSLRDPSMRKESRTPTCSHQTWSRRTERYFGVSDSGYGVCCLRTRRSNHVSRMRPIRPDCTEVQACDRTGLQKASLPPMLQACNGSKKARCNYESPQCMGFNFILQEAVSRVLERRWFTFLSSFFRGSASGSAADLVSKLLLFEFFALLLVLCFHVGSSSLSIIVLF